jgi:hypothetical protein
MTRIRASFTATLACALATFTAAAIAVPLTPDELTKLCTDADGPAHCSQRVEELQMKRLPNLAVRDGAALKVSLYPSGSTTFADTESPTGGRSYTLWDFISEINTVVLYVNGTDSAWFTLLQRTNGRTFDVPADPRLSPDRQRLVTADFCAKRCVNALAVWRVGRDGIRKELEWKPTEKWVDADAKWLDADVVVVEYTLAGEDKPRKLTRRLADPGWTPISAP